MTTIYYIFTMVFLWDELSFLYSPIEKTKKAKLFKELSEKFKGKKYKEYSDELKSEIWNNAHKIIILIWLFVGLMTQQWVLFLGILIFNLLIVAPLSRMTRYSMAYTLIHWVNSLIGFAFGLFVLINHYHLKIDVSGMILSMF